MSHEATVTITETPINVTLVSSNSHAAAQVSTNLNVIETVAHTSVTSTISGYGSSPGVTGATGTTGKTFTYLFEDNELVNSVHSAFSIPGDEHKHCIPPLGKGRNDGSDLDSSIPTYQSQNAENALISYVRGLGVSGGGLSDVTVRHVSTSDSAQRVDSQANKYIIPRAGLTPAIGNIIEAGWAYTQAELNAMPTVVRSISGSYQVASLQIGLPRSTTTLHAAFNTACSSGVDGGTY